MLLEIYFHLCGTFVISVLLALPLFNFFFYLSQSVSISEETLLLKFILFQPQPFFLFLFKLFPPVETFWKAQLEGPVLVRFFPYFLPLVLIAHVCWFTMILIRMHGDTVQTKLVCMFCESDDFVYALVCSEISE